MNQIVVSTTLKNKVKEQTKKLRKKSKNYVEKTAIGINTSLTGMINP